MNDQELRSLVRDAVARHMGRPSEAVSAPMPVSAPVSIGAHPSHALYLTVVNTTDACIIEPSVPCEHCNYCKTHGH